MNDENKIYKPRYPRIELSLLGSGGSIPVCLARFKHALELGGIKKKDIDELIREATVSDIEHMFQVMSETVTITKEEM